MANSSISVVPIGEKICKPFLLEVMVFSPEAGYKFKVSVERSCTPEADPIWKLVFDLFTVADGKETQIIHVSFTAGATVQQKAVQRMVADGVKPTQADILVKEVHPAAKALKGAKQVTPEQKKKLHDAMDKVLSVDVS